MLPFRILPSRLTSHFPLASLPSLSPPSFSSFPSLSSSSFLSLSSPPSRPYTSRPTGTLHTSSYRLFIDPHGYTNSHPNPFSSWHHIPLKTSPSTYNFINEIPLNTTAKYEISTEEAGNPIKQDEKKGKLRHFTYGNIPFNYGALPQTWENCHENDTLTGLKGDNDPLDVVEISSSPIPIGSVFPIKILGCIALIDEGETDYKIIGIYTGNPLSNKLHSIADIGIHIPQVSREMILGLNKGGEEEKILSEKRVNTYAVGDVNQINIIDIIFHWFKYYKTTDGKGVNTIGLGGRILNVAETKKVIEENHLQWEKLTKKKVEKGKLWIPKEWAFQNKRDM